MNKLILIILFGVLVGAFGWNNAVAQEEDEQVEVVEVEVVMILPINASLIETKPDGIEVYVEVNKIIRWEKSPDGLYTKFYPNGVDIERTVRENGEEMIFNMDGTLIYVNEGNGGDQIVFNEDGEEVNRIKPDGEILKLRDGKVIEKRSGDGEQLFEDIGRNMIIFNVKKKEVVVTLNEARDEILSFNYPIVFGYAVRREIDEDGGVNTDVIKGGNNGGFGAGVANFISNIFGGGISYSNLEGLLKENGVI